MVVGCGKPEIGKNLGPLRPFASNCCVTQIGVFPSKTVKRRLDNNPKCSDSPTRTLRCSFPPHFFLYRATSDWDAHKLLEQLGGVLESQTTVTPSPRWFKRSAS
jgi:hypothetical protein